MTAAPGVTHHVAERHRPLSFIGDAWSALGFVEQRWAMVRYVARRAWWWPILFVLWLYVGSGASAPLYEAWGLGHAVAVWLSVALLLLSAVSLLFVIVFVLRGAYSRMRPPNGLFLLISVGPFFYICAMANKFGLALPAVSALSAAILTIFNVWMRWATDRVPTPVTAPIWLDEPSRAADMVRDCERALAEMAHDDEDRSDVEINLASALALVALGSEGDEALTRACDLLAATLERAEPTDVYIGAARLVEAMGAKADRTGDVEGYDEALQLMLDAAGLRAQVMPGALPRALLISATHLSALSARAQQDGQPGRTARLHRDALEDLLKALELASPRGTVHALARLKFAALVDRSGANLDAAIALSRGSLRRLSFSYAIQRDFGRLVLWDLLMARAERDPARARRDLGEVKRLDRRLQRRAASRVPAARRRPALLRATGSDDAAVAGAYRQAFDGLSLQSGSGAADLAAEWAAWADGRGDAAEAAQAHWSWVRAVADDARRRPLRAEKERRLAHVAGLAARAGERLIAAGRTRDAAVAFDLGRATLLTERMERDRDRLTERLAAAGHDELAARWEHASRQIAHVDRDGFVKDGDGVHATVIGGRRFQRRFTSIDQVVLAERQELLRAIRRIRGFEDIDAPADFDDLRLAAAEGPLVYVSATDAGASAIVVTNAAEPAVLSLALDTAGLEPWLARLREADEAGALSDVLAKLLPWLWEIVGEPLAAQIAPGSLVTLVPLGALALLPLHAMAMAPAAEGGWHDRSAGLVFRYAPNARVLARSQAQASALAGEPQRVLTVAVPDAPVEAVIAYARDESAAIAARWPGRTVHLDPGSRPAVLEAMDGCGVWHFACHGVHLPGSPLDSRLVLADGPLTLRTIFARPQAAARLAVLSACRTATPDERLLDEVVSFPSALLQAGVAGVVSPQSDVDDRGATLLVLRFFDELARGVAPARALAQAQQWLAGATNAQIRAELGDVYGYPAGYSAAQRAFWDFERDFSDPHHWATFSYCGA